MLTFGDKEKAKDFEKIYFENYSSLCKSIYRFVKDEDITKDIVQDVFVKYWQKIHELSIRESPRSYLRKACINQAINYLKEKERRENREQIFLSEKEKYDISARPDISMETNELSVAIQTTIDHLPDACRNTFLLSRQEHKSYKEIAALLSISINTVEKHIGKALKKLREQIRNI